MLIEGSGSGFRAGSGSIPLTSGSGSGSWRPKNTWIRIRIRIRNTGMHSNVFLKSWWSVIVHFSQFLNPEIWIRELKLRKSGYMLIKHWRFNSSKCWQLFKYRRRVKKYFWKSEAFWAEGSWAKLFGRRIRLWWTPVGSETLLRCLPSFASFSQKCFFPRFPAPWLSSLLTGIWFSGVPWRHDCHHLQPSQFHNPDRRRDLQEGDLGTFFVL